MLPLKCVAQQYEWGKLGSQSAVAQLMTKGQGITIDESKPYAEYWFGTHPNGPSKVILDNKETLLQDYLLSHPTSLGVPPYNQESTLPYLLKILSVGKALSVQAHPDKTLAQQLYQNFPNIYKDSNHKPEMTCALTPFEALCSFRSPQEIVHFITTVPELRTMIGEINVQNLQASLTTTVSSSSSSSSSVEFSTHLRQAYHTMMSQTENIVKEQTSLLENRLQHQYLGLTTIEREELINKLDPDMFVLRLARQYPNDIGIFCPYLLNLVRLQPGEAMFLGANEPHAYLAGDCVEIMACSDNVVRAGLTPKYKDIQTLCSMLTYYTGKPEIIGGKVLDKYTKEYNAPVPEFLLQCTTIANNDKNKQNTENKETEQSNYTLPTIPAAAIIIVTEGMVTLRATDTNSSSVSSSSSSAVSASDSVITVRAGQIWLQPANISLSIENVTHTGESVVMYRAHANTKG